MCGTRSAHVGLRNVSFVLWLALGLATPCLGQQTFMLALKRPGQASVSIDLATGTAIVVDLGNARDGNTVELEGKPLLDALEARGVSRLVVICSHPDADHMGGIRALFSTPRNFFRDTAMHEPRFTSITVIDSGMQVGLYGLLQQSLQGRKGIATRHVDATSRNGMEGLSVPGETVTVETVPYPVARNAGRHGRSVVTLTTLGGKHRILDFDDGDSSVIRHVVDALKARGITVDTIVVPHHGSRYQDIGPVFELGVKRAIISVDPGNQYKHPTPEIVISLVERLGGDNVLFTGSIDHIVLDPEGVRRAVHTAAQRSSYALFIEPGRERGEREGKGLTEEQRGLYEKLRATMVDATGGSEWRVADDRDGPLRERVRTQGTIVSPEFALGEIPAAGSDPRHVMRGRPFGDQEDPSPEAQSVVYAVEDSSQGASPGSKKSAMGAFARRTALRAALRGSRQPMRELERRVESDAGFDDGTQPPPKPRGLDRPTRGTNGTRSTDSVPEGGLVYLAGGRVYLDDGLGSLAGGSLDVRNGALCIGSPGVEAPQAAPYCFSFGVTPLFVEVWTRTVRDGADTFYLSINPTKQFLRDADRRIDEAPSAKLEFGWTQPSLVPANEVVTAGDIEQSRIGEILWNADVYFKSVSLGFDVITGAGYANPTPPSLAKRPADIGGQDHATRVNDRWCRLYWTSGDLRLSVDPTSRRIRLEGNPVEAHAEAMQRKGGALVSYPGGGWCEDVKGIARQAARSANSPTATGWLQELRRVAQYQSLARWARESGARTTDAFDSALVANRRPSSFHVPLWTSGIKSDAQVIVQEERSNPNHMPFYTVHVGLSDSETAMRCVLPNWERRLTEFESAGYRWDTRSSTWVGAAGAIVEGDFLPGWMTRFATRIAKCAKAQVLPTNGLIAPADDGEAERYSSFGYNLHFRPISYHGGVLLGVAGNSDFLENAWKRTGCLRTPGGRLLFQRIDDELHFWNQGDPSPETVPVKQHASFAHASIVAAQADRGRLRFLVETNPAGVARRELRMDPSTASSPAMEWVEARQGSNAGLIVSAAARPCGQNASSRDSCMEVSYPDSAPVGDLFGDAVGDGASGPLDRLRVRWVTDSSWVVDMDVSDIEHDLDEQWRAAAGNPSRLLSTLAAYTSWGFDRSAEVRRTSLISELQGETQDTVLEARLAPSEQRDLDDFVSLLRLTAEITNLSDGLAGVHSNPRSVANQMRSLEKRASNLLPATAVLAWKQLAEAAQKAIDALHPGGTDRLALEALAGSFRKQELKMRALSGAVGEESH